LYAARFSAARASAEISALKRGDDEEDEEEDEDR